LQEVTSTVNPPVERRELAPGLSISRVLTGLWQIADMERDGRTLDLDATARAMGAYVDAGFTTFDMADHYGSAEEVAGRFASARASSGGAGRGVQLFTKWVPNPGPVSREDVRAAVQRSLERLKARRIDLLQLHAWRFSHPSWIDCLVYLEELQDEGLIAHVGLVNFDTAHLRIALSTGFRVASNQVAFSLLDQRPRGRMAALCRERGIQLLAYGTLAGGLLTERWLGRPEPAPSELVTWSQMKYARFVQAAGGWQALQGVLRAMAGIAQKHRVSLANVASRAILDEPSVAGVIIGARLGERAHLEDNARLFSFTLDADDRSALAAAQAALQAIPGDCGDEYRKPPFLTASGDLSHHVEGFPPPYTTRAGPDRTLCLSGTPWEPLAGYSRAVRKSNRISVSGTTASHLERAIGGQDPTAQTHFVIDKLEGALESLGARLEDVVRTRVFVRDIGMWEPVARAHGERFGHIQPANTLVEAALVSGEALVEIEAEAEV
jgi:aryl-alcohol dehydrogenase-like predicted oxidoreductase/enamine deaminase RidA (YjgF/YER057c/UK114 family)